MSCSEPAPPPSAASSPVPFDAALANWPDRSGVFAGAQPIAKNGIRARDAQGTWSGPQQDLLSPAARKRTASVVPIGGDYWADTPYPIAPASALPWVSSAFLASGDALPTNAGDKGTGAMASRPFRLSGKFLRMAIGGSDDPSVGVELLARPEAGHDLSRCEGQASPRAPTHPPSPPGYVRVYVRHAAADAAVEREQLRRSIVPLDAPTCPLDGLEAIVRVFDDSTTAHVNVGTVDLTDLPPDAPEDPVPVWGFADFHTHPTDYLSFGGLQGIHVLWGAPGGPMSEYVDDAQQRANLSRDIPACDGGDLPFNAHHGGYTAPTMINAAEGRLTASVTDLGIPSVADMHYNQGGPTFADFPSYESGAHEQYHITQIHRAYLGGLRLISALAVHNPGIEYGSGWVRCGDHGRPTVDTTRDWTIIQAHARVMRQLAQLNHEWMEIAYTPDDARRIIRANKLAVILGVEMPQLGEFEDGDPATQVARLEALGIRQVVLVHGMDNLLAGSAIFQDLYNSVNDWMHRPERDRVETLSGAFEFGQFDATFFDITTDPSPPIPSSRLFPPGEARPTEPVMYRLGIPQRAVLSDLLPRPGRFTYYAPIIDKYFGELHTLVSTAPFGRTQEGPYDKFQGGHRNTRGLTGRGAELIGHLMERGMLVDLAHMSDQTLTDVYSLLGKTCEPYPLMISHTHFRRLAHKVDYSDRAADLITGTSAAVLADLVAGRSMAACIRDRSKCDPVVLRQVVAAGQQAPQLGEGTVNRENLPREFDSASSEIQEVQARRGAIGVFMGQGPIGNDAFDAAKGDLPEGLDKLPFTSDCAASSKGLAAALLFGNARMHPKDGPPGVMGVASDFTLVGNTVPRFGPYACAGYEGAGASSASAAQLLETLLNPSQYKFGDQRDAIVYSAGVKTCPGVGPRDPNVPCGSNAPLDPYKMGDRTYDFNVDGLAQYGLVPDLLQDVANVMHGAPGQALDPVFQSANGYIDMWEHARALSGCEAHGLCPKANFGKDLQCEGREVGRTECGSACPCGWNRGAPLQELHQSDVICDPGKTIEFPVVDGAGKPGFAKAVYQQRRANVADEGDLTEQGDWGVFPIGSQQTWTCGGGKEQLLDCPAGANYVKVRRVLDTTVSPASDRCDVQPLPPEAGNRRVIFQCLTGAPHDAPGARR